MKKSLNFLIPLLLSVSCNTKNDCYYQNPIDKKDGLTVSTLEEHSLDRTAFDKANSDICKGRYGNIHSLLVIHKNDLVVEQYYNRWDGNDLHFLASTTKSFGAILTGIAIERGEIEGVNQKMADFFPDNLGATTDPLKREITIKHLLTNTSGFEWDEVSVPVGDPNNSGLQMEKSDDWFQASIDLPMDTLPGTKYTYSGPNNIIIGEIIKASTGKNIARFAEENLFKPLGIQEYRWSSKNGIYDVGGGLFLKSRDIAKYGLLHLNKGKWKNQEVVSEEWMAEIFDPYIEIKHPVYGCSQWQMVKTEYGFNSWFIPGNGGQIINVVPDLELVIIINADNRKVSVAGREPLEYLIRDITKIHPRLRSAL